MILLILFACLRDDVATLKTDVKAVDDQASSRDAALDERMAALEARLTAAETRLAAAEGELAATSIELAAQGVALEELLSRMDAAEAEVLDLSGNLFGNELWDNEQQAALDALDSSLAELALALDDQVLSSADLATRVTDAETLLATLQDAVGDLGGLSSAINVATVTQNYASGGQSTTWQSMSSDVTLTLDVAGPVVAWCSAMDFYGNSYYRIGIESADGSWSDTGEVFGDNYTSGGALQAGTPFTAMAAFEAPAPGDYIVSCEGYFVNGVFDLTLIALAG